MAGICSNPHRADASSRAAIRGESSTMPLSAGPAAGVPAIDDPAFGEILQLLRERTGTDFASYRLPTVARRTVNRMISVGAGTFADYLQLLRQREGEAARL